MLYWLPPSFQFDSVPVSCELSVRKWAITFWTYSSIWVRAYLIKQCYVDYSFYSVRQRTCVWWATSTSPGPRESGPPSRYPTSIKRYIVLGGPNITANMYCIRLSERISKKYSHILTGHRIQICFFLLHEVWIRIQSGHLNSDPEWNF